jgi:hypothetical protein
MSIKVNVTGELGNQMFSLAAGFALSSYHRVPCDLYFVDIPSRLSSFQLSNSIRQFTGRSSQQENSTTVLNQREETWSFFRRLRSQEKHSAVYSNQVNEYFEKTIHSFDSSFRSLKPGVTLNGYFQSWKYFDQVELEIKEIFEIRPEKLEAFGSIVEEAKEREFTAVHIRRGSSGYSKLNREYHGLLPLDYYWNAIGLLKAVNSLKPIWIFTDNLQLAQPIIAKIHERIEKIISPNEIPDQAVNLKVMSMAHSIIGANSSYSWWAAYLNRNNNATKIFPRPWYLHAGEPEQELLPPKWLTVSFESFMNK